MKKYPEMEIFNFKKFLNILLNLFVEIHAMMYIDAQPFGVQQFNAQPFGVQSLDAQQPFGVQSLDAQQPFGVQSLDTQHFNAQQQFNGAVHPVPSYMGNYVYFNNQNMDHRCTDSYTEQPASTAELYIYSEKQVFIYRNIVEYIRETVAIKINGADVENNRIVLLGEMVDAITAQNQLDLLIFSLEFGSNELKVFEFCYRKNAEFRTIYPNLRTVVEFITDNWTAIVYNTIKNQRISNKNRQYLFLYKYSCEMVAKTQSIFEYIGILKEVELLEKPLSQVAKVFIYSRIMRILDILDYNLRKMCLEMLYDTIDNYGDLKNPVVLYICEKLCYESIGCRMTLELQMLRTIFLDKFLDSNYARFICDRYMNIDREKFDANMKAFVKKVSRMCNEINFERSEVDIHVFQGFISELFRSYLRFNPQLSILAISNFIENINKNKKLGFVIPILEAFIKVKISNSTPIAEIKSVLEGGYLENKEAVFNYIFDYTPSFDVSCAGFVLTDRRIETTCFNSRAVMYYQLFKCRCINESNYIGISAWLIEIGKGYYQNYMMGCLFYLLGKYSHISKNLENYVGVNSKKQFVYKELSKISSYMNIYINSFRYFQAFISAFGPCYDVNVMSCVLYGLNKYFCYLAKEVENVDYSDSCKLPEPIDYYKLRVLIINLIHVYRYLRPGDIKDHVDNAIVCTIKRISKSDIQDATHRSNIYKVASYVITALITEKISLYLIYTKYFARNSTFVTLLFFNYFKEMCYTLFKDVGVYEIESIHELGNEFVDETVPEIGDETVEESGSTGNKRPKVHEVEIKALRILEYFIKNKLNRIRTLKTALEFKSAFVEFAYFFSGFKFYSGLNVCNSEIRQNMMLIFRTTLDSYMANVCNDKSVRTLDKYVQAMSLLLSIEEVKNKLLLYQYYLPDRFIVMEVTKKRKIKVPIKD